MKNSIFSLLIFLTLIIFMLYSHNLLIKMCNNIVITCDVIEQNIKDKNLDEASTQSNKLIHLIEHSESIIAVYINHSDLDCILTEAAKVNEYINLNATSDALASIKSIKISTINIKSLQNITLKNIF